MTVKKKKAIIKTWNPTLFVSPNSVWTGSYRPL